MKASELSADEDGCGLLTRGCGTCLQRRLASLFPDWFPGVDGFDNDVSLVANALAGMELSHDLAEARIGEGYARKIKAPKSAKIAGPRPTTPRIAVSAESGCSGAFAMNPPMANA